MVNPDWASGMGSSLATGLRAVPENCVAAVLALVDQPLVGPAAVARLISAYAAGAQVAVAAYDGQPREPVLIAREYWPEVIDLAVGDVGARPFLRAHPDLVTLVECADTGRPDDVDTPDDLARLTGVTRPSRTGILHSNSRGGLLRGPTSHTGPSPPFPPTCHVDGSPPKRDKSPAMTHARREKTALAMNNVAHAADGPGLLGHGPGVGQVGVTSMPQVWVTLSPGSSISRSTPETKAFGGQVIGSMATAFRRCDGSSVSPVKTCSHS